MTIDDLYFVSTNRHLASLVANPTGLLGFTSSKEAYDVASSTNCPPYVRARVITSSHYAIDTYRKDNEVVYVKEPNKAPWRLV